MSTNFRIRDFQVNEKPRERLVNYGTSTLSDAELLAILLRSGGNDASSIDLANNLLKKFKGLRGLLNARYEELIKMKYIGPAKATCLKATAELALRANFSSNSKKIKVAGPKDVFKFLRKDIYRLEKEHLYIINLDSRNYVISKELISVGTVNETLIHPREIYREAILKNASYIILCHNHPSGDTSPSDDDISVTKKIYDVGKILGIPLVDHVVLSPDSYTSLKARNLLENTN